MPGSVLISLLRNTAMQKLYTGDSTERMRSQLFWDLWKGFQTEEPLEYFCRQPPLPETYKQNGGLALPPALLFMLHTYCINIIPVYFMLGFRMLLAVRQRCIFKCFIHVSLDCSFAKGLQILHQLLTLLIPPLVLLLFQFLRRCRRGTPQI